MVKDISECQTIAIDPKTSKKAISEALRWIEGELAETWQIDYFYMVSNFVFSCQLKNTNKIEFFVCDDELNLSIPIEELKAYIGLYRHLIGNPEVSNE